MAWLLAIDSIDLREVASFKKAENRKKQAGLAGRLKNTPSPPYSPSTLPPPSSLEKSSRKVLVIAETAQAASRGDDLWPRADKRRPRVWKRAQADTER